MDLKGSAVTMVLLSLVTVGTDLLQSVFFFKSKGRAVTPRYSVSEFTILTRKTSALHAVPDVFSRFYLMWLQKLFRLIRIIKQARTF